MEDWAMRRLFVGLLAILWAVSVGGCGSGKQSETAATPTVTGGRSTFTVVWPDESRLVPAAANSVRVEFLLNGGVIAEGLLVRPTGGGRATTTFNSLPVRTLLVRATAFPTSNGMGIAQATGSMSVTIRNGEVIPVTVTMASTIVQLEVTPVPPTITVGQSLQLSVTAKDSAGNIVLTAPSKMEWSSSHPAVSVDNSGVIQGIAGGTATITVKELESGKSVSVPVTVVGSGQTFVIKGVPYVTAEPQETLTATFTPSEGGATVSSYKGYVLLHVSGIGQAYANQYNDAFYVYSGPFEDAPANGHDGGFYQLAFGTSPLPERSLANNAKNFLVGPVPAYNPAHTYTVILDTKLTNPGQLHFGVTDGGYSDNTGAYTITVTQLVPAL